MYIIEFTTQWEMILSEKMRTNIGIYEKYGSDDWEIGRTKVAVEWLMFFNIYSHIVNGCA